MLIMLLYVQLSIFWCQIFDHYYSSLNIWMAKYMSWLLTVAFFFLFVWIKVVLETRLHQSSFLTDAI